MSVADPARQRALLAAVLCAAACTAGSGDPDAPPVGLVHGDDMARTRFAFGRVEEDGGADAGEPIAEPGDAPDAGTGTPSVVCTRRRFLHIASFSFVPRLDCAGGECGNGCWGVERRGSGFRCDYRSGQADYIATGDGGGPFASYNEIKPLNAHDAEAVANCKHQSGHPVRTYVVWNGAGWDHEGIRAAVHFAELFGTQAEAQPHYGTWYAGFRGTYAPMINVSPETRVSGRDVYELTKKICRATRLSGWLGVYFYDPTCAGGMCGMAEWKRASIIRALNDCTTE